MTSVLIVRKPFLLLTCCWRERWEESPFIVLLKGGRYPHYLTPYQYAPYPWGTWGRGSLTQTYDWSMNGDSKYLPCCEWRKKNLRFHLPLRLIEKRFEIPAHTLKNLIFFCPIIFIPLLSVGFGSTFGPCYARITVGKNLQKCDTCIAGSKSWTNTRELRRVKIIG